MSFLHIVLVLFYSDLLSGRGKRSEVDWETYRKSWFEVKIHSSSLNGGENERNTDTAPSSFQSGGSPYYMDYNEEKQGWVVYSGLIH